MVASIERPTVAPVQAIQVTQGARSDAPVVVDPGVLHVDIDADAPYVAGRLNAGDTSKAREILTYLRQRGVLVTACSSGEEILLTIAQPIAHELLVRIAANSALLRAYMACPQCGRRHSLSPPYGWCWPCSEEARQAERGPCAFVTRTVEVSESEEVPHDS